MSITNKKLLYFLLLLVSLIWGSTFVVMKMIAKESSPFLTVFLRTAIGSLCFGIALYVSKQKYPLKKPDIPLFFLLGLLGNSSFMLIQMNAMSYTYASHGSMLIVLAPIIATLIACFLGWQAVRSHIVLGLGLAFLGAFFLLYPELSGRNSGGNVLLGDALIVISAVFWASFTLLGKKVMSRYPPFVAVAYTNFFAFVQLVLFLILDFSRFPQYMGELSAMSWHTWISIIHLGVFASFFAYIVWYEGVHVIGPVKTSTFQYFNPLVGSLAALIFLGENLTLMFFLGGLLIISGVFLVNRSR